MAEPRAARMTIDDLEALPYDEWHRYELIDGELIVTTAPHEGHQRAGHRCGVALTIWNDETHLGEVIPGVGLVFSQFDAVIPDLVWVSKERRAHLLDAAGHFRGAPELVVEVLSPGSTNRRRDRETKLRLYSTWGVDEYWIIDWRLQRVEVYRRSEPSAPLRLAARLGRDDTLTSPLLPGFALVVARLFDSA